MSKADRTCPDAGTIGPLIVDGDGQVARRSLRREILMSISYARLFRDDWLPPGIVYDELDANLHRGIREILDRAYLYLVVALATCPEECYRRTLFVQRLFWQLLGEEEQARLAAPNLTAELEKHYRKLLAAFLVKIGAGEAAVRFVRKGTKWPLATDRKPPSRKATVAAKIPRIRSSAIESARAASTSPRMTRRR